MASITINKQTNDENDVEIKQNKDEIMEDEQKIQFKQLIAKNLKQPKLDNKLRSKLPKIVQSLYDHKCEYHVNPKDGGSVTFYPSPHLKQQKYGTKVFPTEKFIDSAQLKHFLTKLGCKSIESVNDWDAAIVQKKDSFHGFVRSMEIAYFEHYPLKIKVSHIWLLIMHALSSHIDVNAEKLRSKFVTHQDKKTLTVQRAEFVKGSRQNDWQSIIEEFSEQIDKNTVHNIAQILENDFSTTTNLEKIASKVSLMAACKHYFSYLLRGGCGFHQITLSGNKSDWIRLKKKVELLFKDRVDKQWANKWRKPLFDILDRFIAVYDGEIDCLFWNSMIRRGMPTSGGMAPNEDPTNINSYYSGWINIFFPYLNEMRRCNWNKGETEDAVSDPDGRKSAFQENQASKAMYSIHQFDSSMRFDHQTLSYVDSKYERRIHQPLKGVFGATSSLKVFPIGLANAPVLLEDLNTGKQHDLKFAAGFIGVEQDEKTLEVCPKIGWFIAEK